MQDAIDDVRQQMCEVGRRIWLRGYCAGNEGNHSVRLGDNRVLCTPTNMSKGFMDPEDMCVVDLDGRQVEANPRGRQVTSEILLHLAIYEARPDVTAVVHSHPPHATAFALAGMPVPEGVYPEAEQLLRRVPLAPYARPGSHDLPRVVKPLIRPDMNTVLLSNHGSVSFSSDGLIDAYHKLEVVDAYCRILLLLRQLGQVSLLGEEPVRELHEAVGRRDEDEPPSSRPRQAFYDDLRTERVD